MNNFSISALAIVAGLAFACPAFADNHDAQHREATPAAADKPTSEGMVKSVDKEAGLITIKHGPMAHLRMGAMTMPFYVKDPASLARIKTGDKVKFVAEDIDGKLTVVSIKSAK